LASDPPAHLSCGRHDGHAQKFRRPLRTGTRPAVGDPLSGHSFLFCNAQRNRLKPLFLDGSGLWVCARRLEKGRFLLPEAEDEESKIILSHEELMLLVGGIDLAQTRRRALT
jgi:transposase